MSRFNLSFFRIVTVNIYVKNNSTDIKLLLLSTLSMISMSHDDDYHDSLAIRKLKRHLEKQTNRIVCMCVIQLVTFIGHD